jgi:hypothetical protein
MPRGGGKVLHHDEALCKNKLVNLNISRMRLFWINLLHIVYPF